MPTDDNIISDDNDSFVKADSDMVCNLYKINPDQVLEQITIECDSCAEWCRM